MPVTPLGFAASYEEANRAAVESVETYLASMAARLSDLEVTTSVRTADPRTAIVDAGAESDLIVLASHGRRDLPRLALGSVADAVVRSAGWPVMVVPAEEERGD